MNYVTKFIKYLKGRYLMYKFDRTYNPYLVTLLKNSHTRAILNNCEFKYVHYMNIVQYTNYLSKNPTPYIIGIEYSYSQYIIMNAIFSELNSEYKGTWRKK